MGIFGGSAQDQLYRENTGPGLKEAKDAVEALS